MDSALFHSTSVLLLYYVIGLASVLLGMFQGRATPRRYLLAPVAGALVILPVLTKVPEGSLSDSPLALFQHLLGGICEGAVLLSVGYAVGTLLAWYSPPRPQTVAQQESLSPQEPLELPADTEAEAFTDAPFASEDLEQSIKPAPSPTGAQWRRRCAAADQTGRGGRTCDLRRRHHERAETSGVPHRRPPFTAKSLVSGR